MARVPTAARKSRVEGEGGAAQESPRKRVTLANHLLSQVKLPKLGRPPRDEEEKQQVLSALVFLKSSGKTNRECAELLEVSERTVNNYLAEPGYVELQHELQSSAKEKGHSTIAALIDEALAELYSIMKTDKSGFVRFKSAETLLNFAGYNMPREESRRDSREEVGRFLALLESRQREQVQVNVVVNQQRIADDPPVFVEGEMTEEVKEIPAELAQYYRQVLPGGKMPSPYEETRRDRREALAPERALPE